MLNPLPISAKLFYPQEYCLLKNKLLELISTPSISDKNDLLKNILISGEDHRFRYHMGFDIIAIIRAIKNRLLYKKKEGASTIEQQLVRVLTNNFERTFKRKIKEILLATTLRYIIPRKSIPSAYLQIAYYGTNMIGLKAALKKLKIPASEDLSVENAAEIVARIKYPEPRIISPKRTEQILVRKNHLLTLYKNIEPEKY
ncbi:MAG: transglycosylase domain-containing protein [Chitinophagaceae bacterium]|nr:transglycosylase domain-containing protein [Chitinophagaceae bacterium]